MIDDSVRRVAYHEAGHAFVALTFNEITTLSVSMSPDNEASDILAMTNYDSVRRIDQMHSAKGKALGAMLIQIAVAGCEAEKIFMPSHCRHGERDEVAVENILNDMEAFGTQLRESIIGLARRKAALKLTTAREKVELLMAEFVNPSRSQYHYSDISSIVNRTFKGV